MDKTNLSLIVAVDARAAEAAEATSCTHSISHSAFCILSLGFFDLLIIFAGIFREIVAKFL